MPVSKTTKKPQRLQELAGRSQQVSVQNLRCSRGHSPWQLQFVQAAEDLCQDCVAIWQEHQHPFGAGLPPYVLLPPKPTTGLPDMLEGHSMAGQGSGAGGAAAAAAADTGGWSTQDDGPGRMDDGVSMVAATDRPYQPRLWR
jgi:hypothetical protein